MLIDNNVLQSFSLMICFGIATYYDELLGLNDTLIGCYLENVFFTNTSQQELVGTVIESQLISH